MSRPEKPRRRPRKLKNPQGFSCAYFHGMIPLAAKDYIREVGDRLGFSDARALGIIVLEHRALARAG